MYFVYVNGYTCNPHLLFNPTDLIRLNLYAQSSIIVCDLWKQYIYLIYYIEKKHSCHSGLAYIILIINSYILVKKKIQ